MTVPYKSFSRFHLIALKCDAHDGSWTEPDHWTTEVDNTAYNYFYKFSSVTQHRARWDFAFRGYVEDGWESAMNLDRIAFVKMKYYIHTPWLNSVPVTMARFDHGVIMDPAAFGVANQLDSKTGCGRYFRDAEQWENYPIDDMPSSLWSISLSNVYVVDLPRNYNFYLEAWNNLAAGSACLTYGQYIFEKGFVFQSEIYTPNTAVWASLKGFGVNVDLQEAEIHYHNPFTNSFDRYTMPATGGQLVLTGLGFKNSNADLGEGCVVPLEDWADRVDHIYVEDIHGNVVATLHETLWYPPFTLHEYTCDSNTQITIQSFPALPAGVYCLRLEKVFPAPYQATTCYGYAGDNRTYPTGEIHAGERLWICVGDIESGKKPVIFSKWRWQKGDNYIFRYYAPIDVRAPLVFYEGMILGISPFNRGTSDLTGLPIFGEIQMEMDNTTREFSKLLAEYWVKNQPVELYVGWQEEPEVWKEVMFMGFVSDYEKPGSTWKVILRDVMEKFFTIKLPRFVCSKGDYPNIHPNHEGREMPEVLGQAQLDTGSSPGAVEAIYVDTTTFKYLAARGSLHDVTAVYSDSVLKATPADYTVTYANGGRTYITFTVDQGDNKITFDCEGYMYNDWNSADGYVQNPAHVMLFVLAFLAEIPAEEIDLESFDDLADLYETLDFGQNAYLVLQSARDVATVLQELFFTFGAKCWKARDGRITVGRKDPTDFTPVTHLFEQIDALEEPSRPVGFNKAVNYAPIKWQFFPTANYHKSSGLAVRQSSIDAFEANIMPSPDWNYPWTDNADLVNMRATEDLLKLGFGDQRIRLPVSIEHIDTLDILDNFRFQDPYGINLLGEGEEGHYYYVEGITYDLLGGTMTYEAIDLQWVLRQYFILGDEDVQAATWPTASEADRMYGYLADETTGKFVDGEPGKELVDENA